MSRLRKIINVKPEERVRALVLFVQYFFIVAVTIAGKSARDTFFLSRFDRSYLPLMFASCAVAVAVAATLYSRLAGKLSAKNLLNGLNLLFIAGLLFLQFRLRGYAIPALYIWVEITVAIISLVFWLAVSEIFDPRQGKRLFGLIGGGGALAAIIVGANIKPYVKAFGSESLLWLVVAALAAQWALGHYSLRYAAVTAPASARPPRKVAGRRFDTYLVSIAAVVALSAVASQVVDFQFKMFAAQAMPNEASLAGYFGNFYAIAGAATLLVQFFFTSALLSRFGLLAGLVALPAFLNVGALAVLIQPVLASAAIGKFSDQTLKFTLNNSALELLWLPVPSLRRKSVRPVVSGAVKYAAESSAGLCTFFLVGYLGLRYLSLVSLAAVAVWILIAFRLKALYVQALASALEKRQVDFDDLVLDAQDPAFVKVIEQTLESSDETARAFALELIEGLPLNPWSSALRRGFDRGPASIRQKILQLAAAEPDILDDTSVLEALSDQGPVALEAIRAVAARQLAGADPILRNLIHSGTPEIQAAAAAVFLERQAPDRDLAAAALARLVDGSDPRGRAAALAHLANHTDLLPPTLLSACLRDPSRDVREAALQVAAIRRDESVMTDVIACLEDPRTAMSAQEALRSIPEDRAILHLEQALREPDATARRKVGILRALASFPGELTAPLLLRSIDPGDLDVSAQAVQSLLLLTRDHPLPAESVLGIPQLVTALLRSAYRCNRMLRLLDSGPADTPLRRDLADRIRETIPIVLGLEMIHSNDRLLADAAMIAGDGDPAKLPLLLELLDNILALEKRLSITPLIEPLPAEERDAAGARLYSDLPSQPEPELQTAVYSKRDWESAIALDHLWRAGYGTLLAAVDWKKVQDSSLTREVKAVVENHLAEMYSTLEKTILLKSVSLFADIPAEKLAKIAQIAQEARLPAGSVVMREGEFGDFLFIVADGAVRVHKAGQTLALLGKGDCVGEMSLLDHAPRSADVTVEEDAGLLRIGREDFNEVTAANPEIMQGIVRLLVRRLREANDKLASHSDRLAKPGGAGGSR